MKKLILLFLLSSCCSKKICPSSFNSMAAYDKNGNITGGFSGLSWDLK